MKGGGQQLRHDVRRRWQCPECDEEQRTDGSVTAVRCRGCEAWMTIVDLPKTGFPKPLQPTPNVPHVD